MANTSGDMTGLTYDPVANSWVPVDPNELSQIPGFQDTSVSELMSGATTLNVGDDGINIPQAGSMVNTVIPNDGSALSNLKALAVSIYGSADMGVIRRNSNVLENEPSGIRPGTMERIVIPAWARNQRGSPI